MLPDDGGQRGRLLHRRMRRGRGGNVAVSAGRNVPGYCRGPDEGRHYQADRRASRHGQRGKGRRDCIGAGGAGAGGRRDRHQARRAGTPGRRGDFRRHGAGSVRADRRIRAQGRDGGRQSPFRMREPEGPDPGEGGKGVRRNRSGPGAAAGGGRFRPEGQERAVHYQKLPGFTPPRCAAWRC